MKRNIISLVIVAGVAAFTSFSLDAQGLGGLLKKGKQALEKVTSTKNEDAEPNASEANRSKAKVSNSVICENGVEIINPLAEFIEVTPIGLYGTSTSENYGNAYLVLKVLMKEPDNKASFGGNVQQSMIAVDADGKMYNSKGGIYSFDTPEGIPVRLLINKYGLLYEGINKNIEVMPIVKFGIWLESNKKGVVTLKNVPIFWDQSPE